MAISPDGSYVVVATNADLLAQGSPSGMLIWERTTGQWTTMPNLGLVVITPDLQHALFESYATGLVTGQVDTNGERDAFLWNRSTGTLSLVSHAARGAAITGDRGLWPGAPVALSADGRLVAFSSSAMDLVTGEYWPRAENAYLWFAGVGAAPAFTSPNAATMIAHAANRFSLSATGGPLPSLMPVSPLPPGLSLIDRGDGTADLAGSPSTGTGGIHALSFRAANGLDPDAMQSFTLTIDESPRITSGTSGSFIPGTPGAIEITTAAYPAAALTQTGALPDGLFFLDHGNGTATISGTAAPGTFGRYPIQIAAQNGFAPNASQSFVITVDTGTFNALMPCRVFDSRTDGPSLSSNATRVVQLAGNCGIPFTARSVSLNVTIVANGAGGFLQAFAGDQGATSASTVNFSAYQTRANNAISLLSLDGNGTLALRPYLVGGDTVDVVLDVNGYFE
jgi:hypothetical protein